RHGRAGFQVADGRIRTLRRLIGVEAEIVQCPPANRIGVLILREGLSIPSDGIGSLSHSPRCAAVTLIVQRAVVCPTRFLRWRMETDVTDVGVKSQWDSERLNGSVQVHIV